MLATQLSLTTIELLENGVATYSGVTPLWSMRVVLQVSCSNDATLTLTLGVNGCRNLLNPKQEILVQRTIPVKCFLTLNFYQPFSHHASGDLCRKMSLNPVAIFSPTGSEELG